MRYVLALSKFLFLVISYVCLLLLSTDLNQSMNEY